MAKIIASIAGQLIKVKEAIGTYPTCCCGCLCCNLISLEFTLNSPSTSFGFTYWGADVIQDPECKYKGDPPNLGGPGSAYGFDVFYTLSNQKFFYTASFYCDNIVNIQPNLNIVSSNVTLNGSYPKGKVIFAPHLDPKLDLQCIISVSFDGSNKATMRFKRVPKN